MTLEEKLLGASSQVISLTWIRLVIIVLLCAGISAYVVTGCANRSFEDGLKSNAKASQELTEERTRFTNLLACDRTNVQSAYEVIDGTAKGDSYSTIKDTFPILDCAASYDTGEAISIRLKPSVGEQFITTVERGKLPIVEDGKIVGTKQSSISYSRYQKEFQDE